MRILLIRPPVPPYAIGLKHLMVCEPLELEYVAAGLEGHEVEIFDMILERSLEKRLTRFKPHIVGTSSYITGVNEVKKICRQVKLWNAACMTVAGGIHASCVPEDFADPAIDCIVRGDGTSVMPEVVEAFKNNKLLRAIPGLVIKGNNGHLEHTGEREYMPEPDSLPLPRRDLVAHLRHRYYYLFHQPVSLVKTTWGCWYRCNFCLPWKATGGKTYSRSPESIVNELEKIEAEDIYIVDDIFLINQNRLSRMAELLRARGIHKKFLVYGRADFIAENEDIIKDWSELGLKAVIVGLEAATDAELQLMDKKCSMDYNRHAVGILRRYGVDTYASLIPQPDYTTADWQRLWSFIKEMGLYYVNISPLTPMPGTLIWEHYKSRITVDRKAHGLWDLTHCVLPTRMPLKRYYRSLLSVYARTVLDLRRASKLTLRTRPPIWSFKYLRLWLGAIRIFFQLFNAHKHHGPDEIAKARDAGPEISNTNYRDQEVHSDLGQWQKEKAL
jgi:radical SAM superfamily enzyme YgiQ (UPF0313 family)